MRAARDLLAPVLATAAALAMPGAGMAAHGTPAQEAAARTTMQIYRCTDAAGHVTLQNDVPCPKDARQERQSVDVPPPLPAYVPRVERMPDVVAAERADEAAAIAAAVKPLAAVGKEGAIAAPGKPGPPPALYACRTWDAVDFLTEDATPAERCAPLQVVGADGGVRTDAAACEKVVDRCAAVPAEGLCQSWRRRVDEAEFRWKFAGAKQDDARRREYQLLAAKLAASTCPR